MNIWLIIGIIAVVGGIIALFVLRKKGVIHKPKPPAYDGNKGLILPTEWYGYMRPDGGTIYIDKDGPLFDESTPEGVAKRDSVVQTVADAVAYERSIALDHGLTPPDPKEYHVYAIKPMFTSVDGYPGLKVQSFTADGKPTSSLQDTAGTVLNVSSSRRPTPGGLLNPFIVIAYQENWEHLGFLFNAIHYEGEHLDEAWQSYEMYVGYSGNGDVHPHREPKQTAAGLMSRKPEAAKLSCAGVTQQEPVKLQRF
jgi:hypothetical protein